MHKKIDYKWVIAALCFLMIFTCLGFCSSARSLFVKPITEALDMKRSVYALTDSFRFISVAIVNVFFGVLVTKFGTRKLIAAGFVSLIISMTLYATANVFWQFYLAGIFLGTGFSWTTTTMVGCVINRWCKENKGTVMGAVLAANGLGGAVASLMITSIISGNEDPFAYRIAFWTIAIILAVVGAVVVLFFRERPENAPQNETTNNAPRKKRGGSWVGIEYARAVKMPYFYMMAACILLTGAILQGITGASAAHLEDVGLDKTFVGFIVSASSVLLAVFKFTVGIIYDKFGLKVTANICTVTAVCVMLALAFITDSQIGRALAIFYGVFSPLALPLETIMLPIYAGDLFGEKSFDKVLGVFVSVNSIGYAVGSLSINACYDIFGNYKGVFIACASIMTLLFFVLQYAMHKAAQQRVLVSKES